MLGSVLPLAARIRETEIHIFHAMFLDHLHNLGDGTATRGGCWLLGHTLRSYSLLANPERNCPKPRFRYLAPQSGTG